MRNAAKSFVHSCFYFLWFFLNSDFCPNTFLDQRFSLKSIWTETNLTWGVI